MTERKNTFSLFHPVSIGSVELKGNLFLAPVAGYSDRAFRSVCYECNCSFAYTEMVSAEALVRGSDKTELIMRRAPNEKQYAVQIFGSSPETMAKASRIVLDKVHPEIIDINCGCPVPKIIKTGAGSSLTKNPKELGSIVKKVKQEVGLTPVTVKIRSGWEAHSLTWKEAAYEALEAGADAITIHPRTRAQGYEGKANWDILEDLVQFVSQKIPVFGSGDLFCPEDAQSMLKKTNCDGIMFARGAMGNPYIFRQTKQLLETGLYEDISIAERIKTGLKELDLLIEDKGEIVACREMRKRFCAYTKGVKGAPKLRLEIVAAKSKRDYLDILSPLL